MLHLNFLKIYNFSDKKRLGSIGDGGYVIGLLDSEYDFYISAGVSTEESFSRDFINMYKMNKSICAAFDGTINNYPYEYTTEIVFYKKNIASYRSRTTANLSYFTENYNDIFLKMDIEGHEFHWLLSLTKEQLNKFKQIVIEFHGINDDSWNVSYENKIECLKKLSKTHYPIHIHGNNYANLTHNIPDVIEVTYVRKDMFESEPELNNTALPIINLDFPNASYAKDYDLNFPPFVN